jgi:hypothetical protein
MRHVRLGKKAISQIGMSVDNLFERAKSRFLGPDAPGLKDKTLAFKFNPKTSLGAIYKLASSQEGVDAREETMRAMLKVAGAYLDARKERAKAQIIHDVQAFLVDAQATGVKTDVATVLGGQLASLMGDLKSEVQMIVNTETTNTSNTSIYDAIGRIGALTGRDDPTVYFVCVHDGALCDECKRLHLMEDEVTPRLWKMSELGSGYHKKGDEFPKVGGLHPNERCVLTHLLPGYSFDADGHVEFKSDGHDEFNEQRA